MNNKIYLYTKFIGVPQIQKNYPIMFHTSINNYKKYISYLFDEQRIEKRLIYFEALTLPSILNQTYQNFEWIIFISNLLQDKYKNFIRSISNNQIKIIEINDRRISNKELIELHCPIESNYISCRLDDDDGLCADYFDILNQYYLCDETIFGTKEFLCVSYNKSTSQFVYSKIEKNYLVSPGLSCKNKHIYSIGSHLKADQLPHKIIDKKYPVIQSAGDHTFTHRSHAVNSDKFLFNMDNFLQNVYK